VPCLVPGGPFTRPLVSLAAEEELLAVIDEPTTFYYANQPGYSPRNFGKTFHGPVTLRYALAHSLNVPTVKVAEMTGYDAVVDMAYRAGMNHDIKPTPSVALGSYDITPIEAAGASSLFPGDACSPGRDIIHSVTNPSSKFTAAIHVYGGDFFAAERSEWDPESLQEGRYDVAKNMKMFEDANALYRTG